MPAAERAAEALIRNPYKSDRTIALEIGVGVTGRRARKRMIIAGTAPAVPDRKRLGRDGRLHAMIRQQLAPASG